MSTILDALKKAEEKRRKKTLSEEIVEGLDSRGSRGKRRTVYLVGIGLFLVGVGVGFFFYHNARTAADGKEPTGMDRGVSVSGPVAPAVPAAAPVMEKPPAALTAPAVPAAAPVMEKPQAAVPAAPAVPAAAPVTEKPPAAAPATPAVPVAAPVTEKPQAAVPAAPAVPAAAPVMEKPPATAPAAPAVPGQARGVPALPELRLTGILWDEKEPLAIINGEWLKEGDRVSGARVEKIDLDGVTIRFEGNTRRIRVK